MLTTASRSADVSGGPVHPGVSVDVSLEERLTREILHSERTRMLILAGLSGSLVVVFPALVLVFCQDYARIFGTGWAVQVVAVLVLLASYELAIRQIVGRRLEQGKTLPLWLRFWSAFVETSVPSILILLGLRQVDPVYPLQSPVTYLYAVFIVLSTLQLDFKLSVFTGCVAAAEYVGLSAVVVRGSEETAGTLFSLLSFYLAKGVTLVLAGFAAGFVADQIKRRVMRVFLALEERQRIVSAFGSRFRPRSWRSCSSKDQRSRANGRSCACCSWISAASRDWWRRRRPRRSSRTRMPCSVRRSRSWTATKA
jgi:adenylate cyclase